MVYSLPENPARYLDPYLIALKAQQAALYVPLVHDGVNTTAVNKPKLLEWVWQNHDGLIYARMY
jgi:hypothetical protein